MRGRRFLVLALLLCPAGAYALTLDFPGNAVLASETITPDTSYDLPTGPWVDGALPVARTEGEVTRQVWQIPAPGVSTLQILAPLRQQLQREGFELLLDCQTNACGGFDFRFATDVASPPDMFVDLSDFRFLSARRKAGSDTETLGLFISRTDTIGYVQVIRTGPAGTAPALATTDAPAVQSTIPDTPATPTVPGDFGSRLDTQGRVILEGLAFESGSAQLGPGPFALLQDLADYLLANPDRQVALVGHTDASGSLEGNITLSKRRAASVLERLVSDYDVPRGQLDAQGMGYLSPIASNLTQAGRDTNRRVEVIVTSTE